MEERILNEILKDTFTLDSLRRRVQVLKLALERQIYRPAGTKDEDENKSELEMKESEWLEKFDKELISGINNQIYGSLMERIEKFIEGVNTVIIYFVFVPDEDLVKSVGGWLRQTLDNPRLVFDFKVDPSLIGGCAIVYKGIYKDYSLRARISDSKEKIIGEFRKYFRQ